MSKKSMFVRMLIHIRYKRYKNANRNGPYIPIYPDTLFWINSCCLSSMFLAKYTISSMVTASIDWVALAVAAPPAAAATAGVEDKCL